ncbi:Pterin-4-alpha-carbinolamine dehydratase [Thermogutta terrifontis]|uniref:Putative pterin-4-alpha-carbinolamine dehydratase n=1 Tax=Thermogutta terrifontis TaxID=1331910 RepID=A0A286RM04_9BACT|nr:4a-hydroxytetrahydrobiopterin dehydratase [Thermogutta terrifontis]ASV76927.1 Pterin-4-alpha-carbinolamine dehydratase [Thermogutta terrifontis]
MVEPNQTQRKNAESAAPSCSPCRGQPIRLELSEAQALLNQLDGWELDESAQRIKRQWRMADFVSALKFFNQVGEIAESLDHHPDLHLERYRHVRIEIWTHSAGGLTQADFHLASRIDELARTLGIS